MGRSLLVPCTWTVVAAGGDKVLDGQGGEGGPGLRDGGRSWGGEHLCGAM